MRPESMIGTSLDGARGQASPGTASQPVDHSRAGSGRLALARESVRDLLHLPVTRPKATLVHLAAAIDWIYAAQDANPDGGVARMFHLRSGWGASYPETTGYIVPTLLDYAQLDGREEPVRRALAMADWEIEIQMTSGAVQGGTVADRPSPAVFNTGQVLFGWCAAYESGGDDRHRRAAIRAADFLVAIQDTDGAWRRHLSAFCSAPVDSYAYNVRTAWALVRAGELFHEPRYSEAGRRNVDAVLGWTRENGWIERNCLNDPARPLLHTIAYAQQGLLEAGLLLDRTDAIERVIVGCRHLRDRFERDGRLFGRYDAEWHPVVRWRCLTGEAQTAVIWHRLARVTGDVGWACSARALGRKLKATQRLSGSAGLRGGIKGSFPVYGWYGRHQMLNWAAKFFADAMMLEMGQARAGLRG